MAKTTATKTKTRSKRNVNKSQAVRDYHAAHPNATNAEVRASMAKKGIDITPNYVSVIKGQTKRAKASKKAKAPKKAQVKGGIGVSELKAAMALVKAVGSVDGAAQALAIVKEIQEV